MVKGKFTVKPSYEFFWGQVILQPNYKPEKQLLSKAVLKTLLTAHNFFESKAYTYDTALMPHDISPAVA